MSSLLVAADPFFDTRRERIIKFAAQNKLPAIYQFREYAVDGTLISYGPNVTDSYRQAGNYVGQILKGAKPGDLRPAADQVRVRHQSQDCQSPRPRHSTGADFFRR